MTTAVWQLYGVNRLIEEKQKDKGSLGVVPTTEKEIRCAEEAERPDQGAQ